MTLVLRTTGFEDYLDEKLHIRALILGAPGAGKTRSASFWPRPIMLNCEKGQMAVADRKLPYFDIHTKTDMDDSLRRIKLEAMKRDRAWDTVILDTLDNYQRRLIQDYLQTNNKSSMSGWQDWGFLDAAMTQLIDALQNLPMNVVVNLHVKEAMEGDEEDGTKQRVYSPKLKGDMRDQIAADFDFVGFMSVDFAAKDGKRVLRRQVKWFPEPRYPFLKDRSGKLGESTDIDFTDEDYSRLLNALLSGMDDLPARETLETVGTAPATEVAPAPPRAGGVVADPSTVATPRRTKAAAPAEPTVEPAAQPAEPAAAETPVAAPAPVPAAAKPAPANIPAAPKPQAAEVAPTSVVAEPEVAEPAEPRAAAASPVPADAPEMEPPTPVVAAEPAAEVAADAQQEAIAAVEQGLGGEVVSDTAPADEGIHEDPPSAPSSQPVASPTKVFLDYKCGEQPPSRVGMTPASGCGTPLRDVGTTNEKLQITALKANTLLCPPCFSAFKSGATT